ncbi:MAG: hypothetical protein L3J19_10035 [Sulfurimonas sp.]|nr:hypothetical protein [Sulfurimonas sp.]
MPLIDDFKEIFTDTVYIESIESIISKKIVYRRNNNLTRDIINIVISIIYADNMLKKLYDDELNITDIRELYSSLVALDINTFSDEIEIVKPFDDYINTAKKCTSDYERRVFENNRKGTRS